MKVMVVLGKLLYGMAKNKLASQNTEIKGDYTVIAHDSINGGLAFMIDCNNEFQLTDSEITSEKALLRETFAKYLSEVEND
jgi:hypothetical protein